MKRPQQTQGEQCRTPRQIPPLQDVVLGCVLDAVADGIVVADPSGTPLFFNPAAQRILPIGEQSVPPDQWPIAYGLYLPDGVTPFPAEELPILRALRGETVPATDIFVRNPQAPEGLWISATAMPLRDPTGAEQGVLMVMRDVTESRRAQEALRRERDWAATIVDTVGSLVVVLDREGRIVHFNRACEITTGYTFEEVIGRTVWDLFLLPEEAHEVRTVFERLCAGDFPNQHENHWVTRAGERRLIVWSNTVLLDHQGQVEFIIGTGIDVTERREAERRIQELSRTLHALLETSPLAIWTVDVNGRLQFWNPAAERMFGWRASELLNQPMAVTAAGQPEDFQRLLESFRKGEMLNGVEFRLRRKEGPLMDISVWTAPLRDDSGRLTAVLGVAEEITERKQLEQQLRQAQKMEAIGRLAGGVAHDFNNLLTVISGYAQMLAESLPEGDELEPAVAEILRATQSASELTHRLLSFSRKQRPSLRLVDLNELVSGAQKMLRRVIGEDVELLAAPAPGPLRVQADPVQIEQVLMNLVINARDAMPGGGRIVIETASVVFDEQYVQAHLGTAPGRHVMLAVSDTGHGMDAETMRQAFDPFFTTKEKGTGLGLSTVYGIVRQHGGHVWVYSEPGVGTTFKIYLPEVTETGAIAQTVGETRESARGWETILVAEDQPDLRRLITEVLRREGYQALAAADAQEALRMASEHAGPIHLLLADVVMPGMSGPALAKRIRGIRPTLKVLFMSGYADRAAVHNGVVEAEAAFLEKPFTKHLLLRKLRETLDQP